MSVAVGQKRREESGYFYHANVGGARCRLQGSFASVKALIQAIREYLDEHNKQPQPFVWTASVEQILAKVNRCKVILETAQ